MANRAYLRIWTRDFSEETMLEQFEKLLAAVPFSAASKGFSRLTIQAVDPSEVPLVEWDNRSQPLDAAALAGWMREHRNADCAYEAGALWDVWVYEGTSGSWQKQPLELTLACFGPDYDSGANSETGHFQADLGFEHYFTGHAGLLGSNGTPRTDPQHPIEAVFLEKMRRPENLRAYHEKTRENIQQLMNWMRAIEAAVPVERTLLWSEGEENLEARLDEILAFH
ncbi:MAG TPA: hypothetical protein VEU31_06630 [Candidatus Acidoferrales bacterium]|nr:hypothetical protein [Candidatus Acidoferrales bacterium]